MSDTSKTPAGKPERAGGRVVLVMLLGLVVLFGGLYAAAWAFADGKVPRGTSVSGVEIGGLSSSEATRVLKRQLDGRVEEPITLRVGTKRHRVDPVEAGLAVDHEASVAEAGGDGSWRPTRLWHHYTGGADLKAVVTVDGARMEALAARMDKKLGREPRNGGVRLVDAQVRTTQPRTGLAVDPADLESVLTEAFLGDGRPVALELDTTQPDIGNSDVRRAREEFANRAVAAPVTVRFGKQEVRLEPAAYAPAITMEPVDGRLEPRLDAKKLREVVDARVSTSQQPVDASIELVDGEPQVVPAEPGVTYNHKQLRARFIGVADNKAGKRWVEVESTVARADLTTKEAQGLGVEEQVSSFTTTYPHADYRNVNLGRAAELIDGTLLEPGETFSLNGIVGERTRANGFVAGTIISDGVYKQELGGSVSQMATTLFNAMYFAGLEDVEHRPHSFYIDRYPMGREATVVWGALDLAFRNNTDHGVLVNAAVTPSTPSSSGEVTVSMYSTKVWDISSSTSDQYDFTQPDTQTITAEDCMPNEGYEGFDVDVTRYFRRAGESALHHSEVFHTTYAPSDTVICK